MESNASLTGWSSIDTGKFVGFTERVMSDMEVILQDFYKQPLFQSIARFGEDLRTHLYRSPGAHNINITPWRSRLVRQLFRTYREAGYDGSIRDMLFSIAKVIDIAKHTDITAGYSTKKAVNVVEWHWLFMKHATERLSHYQLFDQLQPCEVLNVYPGFSFSHFMSENFQEYSESGFPIEAWNDSAGTLLIDAHYDTNINPLSYTNFLSLEFQTSSFVLRLGIDNGKKVFQGISIAKNSGTESVVFSVTLPAVPIGYTPILLVYSGKTMVVRDLLSNVSIVNPFPDTSYKLKLFRPLGDQGNCIREVTYYAEAATDSQQLLFLK